MKKLIFAVLILIVCSFPAMAVERYTATGSGAVSESIAFNNKNVVVLAVLFGLDAACATSENLVVANGDNPTATFYDVDFDTETSYVWVTQMPILNKDDTDETLDITFTNTDANTWILHVFYDIVGS